MKIKIFRTTIRLLFGGFLFTLLGSTQIFGQEEVLAEQDTLHIDPSIPISLSLEGAFDMMLEDNLELKAANFATDVLTEERKATKAHHMPQIGIIANYSLLDEDVALEANLDPFKYELNGITNRYFQNLPGSIADEMHAAINTIPSKLSYTIQDRSFGVLTSTLTWPIFTGGLISAATDAAKAKEERSMEKYKQIESEKVCELIERYYGLQMATKMSELRQNVYNGIEHHVSDAKKMEQNGMLSHAEVLYAEAALNNAKTALDASKHDIEVVQFALKNSLGVTQDVTPNSPFFISATLPDLEQLVTLAQTNNPQLKQLESTLTLVDQAIKKEKSAYLPDIAIMGFGEIANYQLTDFVPNWYIGVGLTFDLFDGFARDHKIRAAKIQRHQVEALQENANRAIETAVIKSYYDVIKAQETYLSLGKSVAFANEYLRIQKSSFAQGMTTTKDVIDANLNLEKTKVERLNAAYSYSIALAQLFQYCGMSSEYLHYQIGALNVEY